jgi:hypothetical protein
MFLPTRVKLDPRGGVVKIYEFSNGYGASVACNSMTPDASAGILELSVISPNGGLGCSTPIAADVISGTETEIQGILARVASLDLDLDEFLARLRVEVHLEAQCVLCGQTQSTADLERAALVLSGAGWRLTHAAEGGDLMMTCPKCGHPPEEDAAIVEFDD